MASPAVNVGTGTTITFASSFFAQITDASWSGISRASIETSHMGLSAPGAGKFGNKTFMPGDLSDPGELRVTMHFNPDTRPPIDQAAETVTVSFAGAGSWAATGYMTGFELQDPLEDKMVATATIKFSGNVTITAG